MLAVQHAPILEGQEPFPVVIFSHGIGGTRNAYSGICSDLTSAVRALLSAHFEYVMRLPYHPQLS